MTRDKFALSACRVYTFKPLHPCHILRPCSMYIYIKFGAKCLGKPPVHYDFFSLSPLFSLPEHFKLPLVICSQIFTHPYTQRAVLFTRPFVKLHVPFSVTPPPSQRRSLLAIAPVSSSALLFGSFSCSLYMNSVRDASWFRQGISSPVLSWLSIKIRKRARQKRQWNLAFYTHTHTQTQCVVYLWNSVKISVKIIQKTNFRVNYAEIVNGLRKKIRFETGFYSKIELLQPKTIITSYSNLIS